MFRALIVALLVLVLPLATIGSGGPTSTPTVSPPTDRVAVLPPVGDECMTPHHDTIQTAIERHLRDAGFDVVGREEVARTIDDGLNCDRLEPCASVLARNLNAGMLVFPSVFGSPQAEPLEVALRVSTPYVHPDLVFYGHSPVGSPADVAASTDVALEMALDRMRAGRAPRLYVYGDVPGVELTVQAVEGDAEGTPMALSPLPARRALPAGTYTVRAVRARTHQATERTVTLEDRHPRPFTNDVSQPSSGMEVCVEVRLEPPRGDGAGTELTLLEPFTARGSCERQGEVARRWAIQRANAEPAPVPRRSLPLQGAYVGRVLIVLPLMADPSLASHSADAEDAIEHFVTGALGFEVRSGAELAARLPPELRGCNDRVCALAIARALDQDLVLVGRLVAEEGTPGRIAGALLDAGSALPIAYMRDFPIGCSGVRAAAGALMFRVFDDHNSRLDDPP